MKKILGLILGLILVVTLSGCNANSEPLKVMTPAGGPALSQVFIQAETDKYSVDVVNGPDPLVAAFGSGTDDFIFAATNMGAKMYNNGIGYKFIAAISFGSYYLVAKQDSDFTIASLQGKDIIAFGQNATPDVILQYVLEQNNVTANISYVDSVATATAAFIADNDAIILTAEPSLSVLASKISGLDVIDMQDEYAKITGESSYPQAGVFAKTSLSDRQIKSFLNDLEDSINKVNNDTDEAIQKAIDFNYGFTADVLKTAIPNCHLGFETAKEVRTDLEAYFNIILDMNGALIGDKLPDDGFYF